MRAVVDGTVIGRPAAWRLGHGSPPTRSAGAAARKVAATPPTPWQPSTNPSPTASTSSTTRSPGRRPASSIPSRWPSSTPPRRGVRRHLGGQRRPRCRHGRPQQSVGHHRRSKHPQPHSQATLTLGDGTTYTSASFQTTGTPPLSLVYGGDVPADGADPADAALCFPVRSIPTRWPARWWSAIVVSTPATRRVVSFRCRRVGDDPRQHDTQLAQRRPALRADDPRRRGGPRRDPRLHRRRRRPDRAALARHAARDETAPQTAVFSSRGPALASADLLKPDVTAPGVDVIAGSGAARTTAAGKFHAISGTSMSIPHIAGLAALLVGASRLDPGMVKSALMTTGATASTTPPPFDFGAGHVDVEPGARPRARVQRHVVRLHRVPVRYGPVRQSGAVRRSDRSERPQPTDDQDRRAGRHADGHPRGHQRRRGRRRTRRLSMRPPA